jgi:signal transduction histidine kinase
MRLEGSLRLRLFLAGALAVVVATVAAAFALGLLFERHVERRVVAELRAHLDQLTAAVEFDAAGAPVLTRDPADPRFRRPLSGLYWQIAVDEGVELLRSRSLWDATLPLPADTLADGTVHRHVLPGPEGAELLVLERRLAVTPGAGERSLRAAVAVDRGELQVARRAFLADLGPYLVVLAVLLVAASAAQIQIGLRPLAAVRARLGEIRSGRRARLEAGFPSEVRPLADEVDALLDARDRQVRRARARAGDLAHGLKTPLQVLAGDAERLRAKGEAELADEIDQLASTMRRHVERELARARLAAGDVRAEADVLAVAERVSGVVARTPAGARLRWDLDVPTACRAGIDADDLAEALGNLVENAARHAAGRVRIEAAGRDGRLELAVVDDGPGIAEADRAAALARGGRLDERAGSGLGLAIVQDIAAAWGGTLRLEDAAPGLRAVLILPVGAGRG